ncbi:MAG: hypothetical protein RLZZ630_1309, partial [Bacteroidota bacterium]
MEFLVRDLFCNYVIFLIFVCIIIV